MGAGRKVSNSRVVKTVNNIIIGTENLLGGKIISVHTQIHMHVPM